MVYRAIDEAPTKWNTLYQLTAKPC